MQGGSDNSTKLTHVWTETESGMFIWGRVQGDTTNVKKFEILENKLLSVLMK